MNNQNNVNQNVSMPGSTGVNSNVQPNIQPSVQPTVQPTVQPSVQPVPNSINQVGNNDPGAVVNENLKKVEINYTPPSKFKVFCLILFFILLVAFVLFLPEISFFVDKYKSGELNKKDEKIVNGSMKCNLRTTTTDLNKDYTLNFTFTNNALEIANFEIVTKGNVTLDEATLDNLNKTCKQLAEATKKINGVSITCDYTAGKLVEIQKFKLKDVNEDDLDSAFVEAGGNNPGYKYGQDMDTIEKQMNASGYTCERYNS